MQMFEEYVYERFAAEINSWRAPESAVDVADVYALSFYVDEHVEPNPRFDLTVELSYNTERHWTAAGPRGADEARWNYAFWMQDVRCGIPDGYRHVAGNGYELYTDPAAADLFSAWRDSLNLPLDADGDLDWQAEVDAFSALCARVGRRLHDEGIISSTFGRPIPIIIHDLEYRDLIVQHTREANPPGVADEFIEWHIENLSRLVREWQHFMRPKWIWESVSNACRDNAFIRDRILQLAATPGKQGLREAGLWTSAEWAEQGLPPPWGEAAQQSGIPTVSR